MFDDLMLILSFFAGVLGTFIGGTQTFICTGFIGIVVAVVQACGGNISFLEPYVLNGLFLPCIIFNGSVVATALVIKYVGLKQDVHWALFKILEFYCLEDWVELQVI